MNVEVAALSSPLLAVLMVSGLLGRKATSEDETDRQTDRQTDRDRQRQRERERETHTHTHTVIWYFMPSQPVRLYQGEERERDRERDRDRQTDRDREI